MQVNGYASRGERSRHIDIRYFFVKDVLRREAIEMKHCKTDAMTADFFTKPLQGRLFKKFRNQIMGHPEIPIEERVGTKMDIKDSKMGDNKTIGTRSTNRMQMTYAEAVTGRKKMNGDATNRENVDNDVGAGTRGGEHFSKR